MTAYAALDHRFTVSAADAAVQEHLSEVLAPLAAGPGPTRAYLVADDGTVTLDDERVVGATTAQHAVGMLLWHVNQEAVRVTAPRLVLLHAAAARRGETVLVLPAPMEHGKTTTVAGLLRAGWDYLSDEVAALDPADLVVHPYPKALSVDEGSWEVLPEARPAEPGWTARQWQVPASRLGAGTAAAGAVTHLVFPGFEAGAPTAATALTPGQVLLQLAASCFLLVDDPVRNLGVLAQVAARVPGHALRIGDLGQAVAEVDRLVAPDAPAPVPGDSGSAPAGGSAATASHADDGAFQASTEVTVAPTGAGPVAGLVVARVGAEAVVFDPVGVALHLLDPIARAVWDRLDGRSSAELVAGLAADFGADETVVRADVETLLARLSDAGLLAA